MPCISSCKQLRVKEKTYIRELKKRFFDKKQKGSRKKSKEEKNMKKYEKTYIHTHTYILNNKENRNNFDFEKKQFKQNGITLVALVVTVIVLLILAGVTLNLLLGENGLLNKAGKASDMQVAANEKEALQMALAELEIAKTKKEIEEITAYILERQLKQDGYNVSVNSDGEVYLVTFLDSKNIYVVDKMGNVEPAERYNINYNLNGGNNPPEQPQTYQRGETVGLLYPTKEGEAFEGWYETSDFSGERITEIRNRREDITVYAKWVEETEQDYFKWSTDGTTITGLNGNTKAEIVVPKKHTLADGTTVYVTTIGGSAFSGHSEITSLKLQNITKLGQYAIGNCTGLEEIEIPKSIETILPYSDAGPFTGCTNLKNVVFEEGIEKIPENIFLRCSGALEVIMPNSVIEIGSSSFRNSGIVKLKMTDNTNNEANGKIGGQAFDNCNNLIDVKISNKITTIGTVSFRNCTGLEEIKIPKSIISILPYSDAGPFTGCTNIKNVVFEEGIEKIPENIFLRCPGALEVIMPNSVIEIGSSSFRNSGITKLKMTDNTNNEGNGKIGGQAFDNCNDLVDVKISNKITTIGAVSFRNCTGLEEIEIPKSITTAIFDNVGGAFTGCTNLKYVSFEEGTEKIADRLFWTCPGLLEVTMPSSVNEIGLYSFESSGIVKLKMSNDDNIQESNGKIGNFAFRDCKKLVDVKISNKISTIGQLSFRNCTGLEEIEIPKSITTAIFDNVGGAFTGCTNLKYVSFEEGTNKVAERIFYSCPGLLEVILPESVTTIDYNAFYNSGITKITIPTSLKTINGNAFANCSSLSTVNYRGDATAWSKISIANGNNAIKNITPVFNYNA